MPFNNPLLSYLVYIIINKYDGGTPLLYIYFTSSLQPDKEVVGKYVNDSIFFCFFPVNWKSLYFPTFFCVILLLFCYYIDERTWKSGCRSRNEEREKSKTFIHNTLWCDKTEILFIHQQAIVTIWCLLWESNFIDFH